MRTPELNPIVVLACPKLSAYANQYPAIWRSLLRFGGGNTKDRAYEKGLVRGYLAALVDAKQLTAKSADDLYDELAVLTEYADLVVKAEADI